MKHCTKLFAHSLENLETISIDSDTIEKKCPKCGFKEVLPKSGRNVLFVNTLVQQTKKWAADDNRKELLQPQNVDGSVNDEFTEAYGYNPLDERTKITTPHLQGGLAQ